MPKNRVKNYRPVAEINVVPYIDVMLVLLVIFMITAPMLSQGVTVDLPKAQASEILKNQREPLIVSVNLQGEYFLNIAKEPESPIPAEALRLRVSAELVLAKESGQSVNVLVKGDQGVSYGKVVAAMGILKQAGATQVGLLTDSATPIAGINHG